MEEYLATKVNPLLEEVVTVLLRDRPKEPIPAMIDFLQTKLNSPTMPLVAKSDSPPSGPCNGGTGASVYVSEVATPTKFVSNGPGGPSIQELLENLRLSNHSTLDDEDELISSPVSSAGGVCSPSHSPGRIQSYLSRGPRKSVSSESTGKVLERIEKYIETSSPQGFQDATRALDILNNSPILSSLAKESLMPIISHMTEVVISASGQDVCLSTSPVVFIDSGEFDCERIYRGKTDRVVVSKGAVLNELSVIYNCEGEIKRLTSISDHCVLWTIEGDYYEYFVKNSAVEKGLRHLKFLQSVPILSGMDVDDIIKLCDAVQTLKFNARDVIVAEGTQRSTFYIIESGKCIAQDETNGDIVKEYSMGDHFGEMALLRNEPRTTNLVAETDCVILSIDRKAFKRLLGPIETILLKNMKKDIPHAQTTSNI